MTAQSYCRYCGAPIRWVHTSHGHRMPLDPAPHPHGNVIVTLGAAIVVAMELPVDRPRFMPHAATCTGKQPEPTEEAPDPWQQLDMLTEGSG